MTASSNSKHVGGCSPQRKCAIITPDARYHNTLPPGTAPTHILAIARSGHTFILGTLFVCLCVRPSWNFHSIYILGILKHCEVRFFLFKLFKGGWHITLVLKYRVQLFGVIFDIWSRRVMKIWPRAYIWTLSSIKKKWFSKFIFLRGAPHYPQC